MKKGEILQAKIERTDFSNKGIAHIKDGDGTVYPAVIKGGLPGQTVEFAVAKKRGGRIEGRLLGVAEKAPREGESPCPHFGACGGCSYLTLPYEESLKIKEEQVRRILEGALSAQKEPWRFEGIKPSPRIFGYRNKMEFSFGDEKPGGPLELGLHKIGGFYDIISVPECRIADEDFRKILVYTKAYFEGVPYFHKRTHEGWLRHLLIRKAARTGEILAALVTTPELPGELSKSGRSVEGWKEGLLRLLSENSTDEQMAGEALPAGKLTGILHILNGSVADVVRADETRILYGRDYIVEELLGLRFRISAFSFFQTNTLGAEMLYETVRDMLRPADVAQVIYDLYSGTGTIAQMLAPAAQKVIGVEIVEEAVAAARKNAALNGLSNCEFLCGDVLKVLDEVEEKPDLIILDPPRDGIHPKALPKIIAYWVPQIIYISCKPTSLARDLEVFLASGYRVERAVACDEFPWSRHVETVVLMSKVKEK
ncbi:MAG: 23S rRNA (uracil(1939)-C(5))-methyltransferase RlmD [Lachnospiraceae bacterium]|nr:23S rRNA (uracil(1939)-C(5))-methyltransferase RlmD [Lachnospiraceae bacterium]